MTFTVEDFDSIHTRFDDIEGMITSVKFNINDLKEKIELKLFSEKLAEYQSLIEDLHAKTMDSEKRLNNMMLELKGIVGMARGALESSKKLALLDEILKKTEI